MLRIGKVSLILFALFVLSSVTLLASEIKVTLDGEYIDASPVVISGRSLLSMQDMEKLFDVEIGFFEDENFNQIKIANENVAIFMTINFDIAYVNGDYIELDFPAVIVNEKVLLPMRFIAETLGLNVEFYDNTIILTKNFIRLVSLTETVRRNEFASISIIGRPYAEYVATVIYNSGPSIAGGLGVKTSDVYGNIYWSWRIGSNTAFGTYEIIIEGDDEIFITTFSVVN